MNATKLMPRYLIDFESGDSVVVFDRETETQNTISFKDFKTLSWMKEIGSMAGEAAHLGRYSRWSKSQRWASETEMVDFWNLCKRNNVDLRFLPESVAFRYRCYAGYANNNSDNKSGINDLLSYHKALLQRPYIWKTCQRPENTRYHDRSIDIRSYQPHEYTKELAGFLYREQLKDMSRIVSADGGKYKKTKPGQIIYDNECINLVAKKLQNHNNGSYIKNGVSTFNFMDGTTATINLSDVLGFVKGKNGKWLQSEIKDTQYVSCAFLLMDLKGNIHINKRTGYPMSFKDIKQYGMVSSSFHQRPGFLRPKFYYHGIKQSIIKNKLIDKYGKKSITKDGSTFTVPNIDWTNQEHQEYFRWLRNTCRIAYEQTVKGIRQHLNLIEDRSVLDI